MCGCVGVYVYIICYAILLYDNTLSVHIIVYRYTIV